MAQNRSHIAHRRTYMIPLMVALPCFFFLYSFAVGWFLIAWVENGWDSGKGNVWQALENARKFIWVAAFGGGVIGIAWAWVILLPLKRYRIQLEQILQEDKENFFNPLPLGERLEVREEHSEISEFAISFNRILDEMAKKLPRRTQAILNSVTNGLLVFDSQGSLEWSNPLAARLFDLPIERIKGRGYQEILERSPELVGLVQRSLESQADISRESIGITDRFDQTRVVSVHLAWVRDAEQKPVSLLLTILDLTRLEAFSAGIHHAEQLTSLGNVAAGIAHEIRNPLASIRGLAQLLNNAQTIIPEKVLSYTKVIMNEVDRVTQVVDRFSLFVTSQDEKPSWITLQRLCESVAEMAGHLSRKRKIPIEINHEQSDLKILVRSQHLIQGILNLVIHSVESAYEGRKVLIKTYIEEDPGNICIQVGYEGAMIPPHELDDMFLPFHTSHKQGTGLGLAITDSIIRDHGGKLEVQSGNTQTFFAVLLPMNETTQSDG